jgi:RNA polymerase sigma-70 factor (ECF subfamily)
MLMERYLEGDARAFQRLMERHAPKMFNFLIRSTGRRDVAEDLVQEVFLRIVRRADSFRGQSKFTTWMFAIARNLIIDTARKERHRRTVPLDAPIRSAEPGGTTRLEQTPDPSPTPDRRAADSRFTGRLEDALAALPDDQREVFLMREVEGMKFREIAQVVGIPINTVKSRMRYALESLRLALADYRVQTP